MISKRLKTFLFPICALPVFISAQLAVAQDTGASGSQGAIEEIVVTATKRAESLVEVPISIAVFNDESIRQTGVRQLKEIAEFIPNLTISTATDFTSTVSIRGVGSNSRNIGFDARVGVYVDGVYVGQSPALNQELLDLERIEVLRGPQGTLFGKNTVAGAINLISKKPEDQLFGSVGVEVGNLDSRQYSGSVNIPLSDKVFFKVAANHQEREGYIDNLFNGDKLNEQDAQSARAQLRVLFSDSFEANLSFDTLQSDRTSYAGEAVSDVLGLAPNTEAPELNEVVHDLTTTEDRDIKGAALTLDWDLDNGYAIKSITGYRDTSINYMNDVDYSSLSVVTLDYTDEYESLSQELQLISPEGDFQYVAGLYFSDQDAFTARLPAVGDDAAAVFGPVFGLPPALADIFFSPGVLSTIGDVTTTGFAAFFNANYQIADAWRLDFGFRYSEEDKEVDWAVANNGVAPAFEIGNGTVVDDRTDTDFSPMVSLNYGFTPDMNAYIKYSAGYKSGGYNLDFLTQNQLDAGIEFDKETVDSYEIGLKGALLDQQLRFAIAVFTASYDDYQVNQFIDLGGGATAISIRNAAKVDTTGLELELTYLPTESWLLAASVGLLDTEFDEFPAGGSGGSDASGKTLPGTSDYMYSLSAQYNHPVEFLDSEFVVRADYSYRDGFFNTVDNEKTRDLVLTGDTIDFGYVDNISRLNARIGLASASGSWSAYLWGRNLTDETDFTGTGRDFLGTLRYFHDVPRTYGIELEYNFQ